MEKDYVKAMIDSMKDKPTGILKFTIGVEVSVYPDGRWFTKAFKMGKKDVQTVKKKKRKKKEIQIVDVTKGEIYD